MGAQTEYETLTVRLPRGLKELVEQTARARSTTVTAMVREALQESLRPVGKLYQQPGFSEAFDHFVQEAERLPVLILAIDEGSGNRYFFQGEIDHELTNDSLVAVRRVNQSPWVIPRRDVVAWFEGAAPARLKELALTLERQGWARRSAA